MLAFFRKYQRFFFVIITVVIVISFSFFGTYTSMQPNSTAADTPAFTAIDGTTVGRYEVEEMVHFLGTDSEDKLLFGGAWGPNFLNDGVIKKDFLETGLAEILAVPYLKDLRTDLVARHRREKGFSPYAHPQAKFISADNAWSVIAPDIPPHLKALKALEDPADAEGFSARVKLFLAERRFPHLALRHVLRLQQKQYAWVEPDGNLDRTDLSLFGYHNIADWFGPRFNRLVAEFVINSAIIAKQRGYDVSKEEAMADLYRNAEVSFQQNVNNPALGVENPSQYFNEQLRRLGMDQNKAVAIWRKVMLFRRLFQDEGNSVFVDPFTIQQFHNYVRETIEGDLYQLPDHLRFGDYRTLQKFEVYLEAVSKQPEILDLPREFKSVDGVVTETPELVQRRYLLETASADKKLLQAKVGIKEAWAWEAQEDNWVKLKNKFPELGVKKGTTEAERFVALDGLDKKTRARVDAFARAEIVEENPEWLRQSLEEAETKKAVVGIRQKGENVLFPGLEDPQPLIELLDQYPESRDQLTEYSSDGQRYFRIEVLDRRNDLELLTFAEANDSGVLDKLLDGVLEAHYKKIREGKPAAFQNSDGSWKPLPLVRQQVTDSYFGKTLGAIKQHYNSSKKPGAQSQPMISDFAASLRFYSFMQTLRGKFEADPEVAAEWIAEVAPESDADQLPIREPLEAQWKIVKIPFKADRNTAALPIDREDAFTLEVEEWSPVYTRANGETAFFQLLEKRAEEDRAGLMEKVMQVQQTLSMGAQKVLMRQLMEDMEAKNALSLKFMIREEEGEE